MNALLQLRHRISQGISPTPSVQSSSSFITSVIPSYSPSSPDNIVNLASSSSPPTRPRVTLRLGEPFVGPTVPFYNTSTSVSEAPQSHLDWSPVANCLLILCLAVLLHAVFRLTREYDRFLLKQLHLTIRQAAGVGDARPDQHNWALWTRKVPETPPTDPVVHNLRSRVVNSPSPVKPTGKIRVRDTAPKAEWELTAIPKVIRALHFMMFTLSSLCLICYAMDNRAFYLIVIVVASFLGHMLLNGDFGQGLRQQ